MTDNGNSFNENLSPTQEIERRLTTALDSAVEAVTGQTGGNPLEVFPNPADKERRADVNFEALSEDQEAKLRAALAEVGIGRQTNRDAEAVGLHSGYTAIGEGGQGHKMMAQLNVIINSNVRPATIIMTGDAERNLPDGEKEITAKILGIEKEAVGGTEFAVAEQVARHHTLFSPQEPVVLSFGYTVDGEVNDQLGQFTQIGTIDDTPVVMMRIDREWEGEGENRKFKRPDNFAKMNIVSKILSTYGPDFEIGFATSSTYQPSVEVDAIRASRETGKFIAVPTYGTIELADVKGEAVPQPPAINQLAGEAYKAAQQLGKLQG